MIKAHSIYDFKINALIKVKQTHLTHLQQDVKFQRIQNQLQTDLIKSRISDFQIQIENEVCFDLPNILWDRKQHIVYMPYENDFDERQIPTKARPIKMNETLEKHCREEIQDLENKNLISKSLSPWSCAAFYVNKNSEIERGTPRLMINYKPLNTA